MDEEITQLRLSLDKILQLCNKVFEQFIRGQINDYNIVRFAQHENSGLIQIFSNIIDVIQLIRVDDLTTHRTLICCIQNSGKSKQKTFKIRNFIGK